MIGLLAPHTLYGTDNSSGLITCVDTVRFGDVTLNKQTFGLANVLDRNYIFISYFQMTYTKYVLYFSLFWP